MRTRMFADCYETAVPAALAVLVVVLMALLFNAGFDGQAFG